MTEQLTEQERIIARLTADRDEWKALAEAAERESANLLADYHNLADECAELERELKEARAAYALECKASDLARAEVERLREIEELHVHSVGFWEPKLEQMRARLATATELLEEWARTYSGYALAEDTRAFLANQPAAPTVTGHELRFESAAPARTEAEQTARQALDDCKAILRELNPRVCTEAEAHVLEAMARIDEMQLQMTSENDDGDDPWVMPAVAELARREGLRDGK